MLVEVGVQRREHHLAAAARLECLHCTDMDRNQDRLRIHLVVVGLEVEVDPWIAAFWVLLLVVAEVQLEALVLEECCLES